MEFEEEIKILFESILKNELQVIYLTVAEDEFINAPEKVRNIIN
jgi:hypothetical protein